MSLLKKVLNPRLFHKTIGYCHVVCDIVHPGHVAFFRVCRQMCDVLVCGVLTDRAAAEKGKSTILSTMERVDVLRDYRFFDKVVIQDKWSPVDNCGIIKPDILFESEIQKDQPANEFVQSYGGKVVQVPYSSWISSTKIKEKIRES